ncbi:hypothetical protein KKG65_03810 [Patescibacteria group bacterium]|nr:hypothetical protein [Patescibacteria group bacterium]
MNSKGNKLTYIIIFFLFAISLFVIYYVVSIYLPQKKLAKNLEMAQIQAELQKQRDETEALKKENAELQEDLKKNDELVTTIKNESDKNAICGEANDLLLEIKQACNVKPFPGVDECIAETESKLEYLGEEDYKKYHMDTKVENIKDLRSRYLLLKSQCEE